MTADYLINKALLSIWQLEFVLSKGILKKNEGTVVRNVHDQKQIFFFIFCQ